MLPLIVLACAVCGAGDPTLSTIGTERTFAGRLRGSIEARYGTARVGAGASAIELREGRLDLTFGYAPNDVLYFTAALPLLHRDARSHDGIDAVTNTLGDAEVRGKGVFWSRDRGLFRHQLSFIGGLKLPTAPVTYDARGVPLPADIQPGTGAIAPLIGGAYLFRRGPWSMFASATLYLPFAVRDAPHASDSFRTTVAAQYQGLKAIAPRLGFSARVDSTGEASGALDRNSGGFVGYVSTEMVASPITDVVFTIGAFFPAIQALKGDHHEGAILSFGVLVDR